MARYISVETTIDDLHTVDPQYQKVVDWCIRVIEAQPAADVAPVRRGEWIDMADFAQCSVCSGTRLKEVQTVYGKAIWIKTPYCPGCGAKMDGGNKWN
ncbi:MAG: hypothetical protein IKF99_11090 [Oscillospiraceae bacterium]|nr:hypothetical protein [Oscillospiraceae bacterium]